MLPPSRPQRSRRAERNPAADVSENQKHPTPRKIYADKLEQEKVATLEDATEMVNLYRDALDAGDCVVAEWRPMNMHSFTVAVSQPRMGRRVPEQS